jgi:hypothetical protein
VRGEHRHSQYEYTSECRLEKATGEWPREVHIRLNPVTGEDPRLCCTSELVSCFQHIHSFIEIYEVHPRACTVLVKVPALRFGSKMEIKIRKPMDKSK